MRHRSPFNLRERLEKSRYFFFFLVVLLDLRIVIQRLRPDPKSSGPKLRIEIVLLTCWNQLKKGPGVKSVDILLRKPNLRTGTQSFQDLTVSPLHLRSGLTVSHLVTDSNLTRVEKRPGQRDRNSTPISLYSIDLCGRLRLSDTKILKCSWLFLHLFPSPVWVSLKSIWPFTNGRYPDWTFTSGLIWWTTSLAISWLRSPPAFSSDSRSDLSRS